MVLATSSLVVWHGRPSGVFPVGEHVFPADIEASTGLVAALRADLAETHFVPLSMLGAERPEPWPFRLAGLRTFLAARSSSLDEVLGGSPVAACSRAHGRALVARLRELGAPRVIVEHEAAELARVTSARWTPTVDLAGLVPDVLGVASLVDADARARLGWPCAVDADIGDLVLLASSCCVPPGAGDVREPWPDELEWTSLLDVKLEEAPVPEGFVRVRPAVYPDGLEALELADARRSPRARALAPAGALLRVAIPAAS